MLLLEFVASRLCWLFRDESILFPAATLRSNINYFYHFGNLMDGIRVKVDPVGHQLRYFTAAQRGKPEPPLLE